MQRIRQSSRTRAHFYDQIFGAKTPVVRQPAMEPTVSRDAMSCWTFVVMLYPVTDLGSWNPYTARNPGIACSPPIVTVSNPNISQSDSGTLPYCPLQREMRAQHNRTFRLCQSVDSRACFPTTIALNEKDNIRRRGQPFKVTDRRQRRRLENEMINSYPRS
jgi:hypothetical protein